MKSRDYLTEDEVNSFDPFGLTEPLTGRYDARKAINGRKRSITEEMMPLPAPPPKRKDFLTDKEVNNFDPFGLTEPLTGRYDARKTQKVSKVRPGGGMPKVRMDPCQKSRDENMGRYDQTDTEGKEYCPMCQCYVPSEIIVNNPLDDPAWPRICSSCASEAKKDRKKCPNCGVWRTDTEWERCDRCGQAYCSICSEVSAAPQMSGYWLKESYRFLCHSCFEEVEEEHDRRREEEAAREADSNNDNQGE